MNKWKSYLTLELCKIKQHEIDSVDFYMIMVYHACKAKFRCMPSVPQF